MKARHVIASALVLLLAMSWVSASNIKDLTAENFDSQTSSGTWFIKFYAPWCGFCQHLEPTWEEFATSSQGSSLNVARVNCDEHRMLCRRFEVDGYPTLKLIVDGYVYDYPGDGQREVNAFKEFATTGFQKERGVEAPTGNGMFDPILAIAETMVLDLLAVYEKDLVAGIAILVVSTVISIIFALFVLPFSIGISPSFLVPRTIYVLRRPGQPPVIVSEPQKYQKIKTE